jgi:ribosome recycling factor
LRIAPYDKSQSPEIEKAINDADLGVSVAADDNGLRVIFPDLTSERREMLVKQAHKKLEEARISIRKERDDVWGEIQDEEKDGKISEDDKFKAKEDMQKLVDDFQKELENLTKAKEEEINA